LTNENIAFKIQINQSDCSADIIYYLIGYSEQLSTNRGKTYIFVLELILQSDIIKAINIQSSSFSFEKCSTCISTGLVFFKDMESKEVSP